MSFNVNVDGRTTNDINFVYTTSNISVDNISSDNFSTTNASIVNLSATTLELQNLDLNRENVSNISVSNISISNGTATFLSSSVLIANSSTLFSSIKNLSSDSINVSTLNFSNNLPQSKIIGLSTSLDSKQDNICVGPNLLFNQNEITLKPMPEFTNLCIKHDLNMIATSSRISCPGKINASNLCVSNGSFGNLTSTYINSSQVVIPSQVLTSSIYNLSTHKINSSILNVDLSLNISSFDKFKDNNGSTIIDKIETRQANICVGPNLLFNQNEITIKPMPELTNLCVKHDLNMIATSSRISCPGTMNASNLCVSNGSFGNLTSTYINSSQVVIPSQLITSEIYNLSSNKINSSILNVDLSLNISSFDKFKDNNGSTIIDKINTRQANICVGPNLLFNQNEITIKPMPELTNLCVKHDLNMIATSSRINCPGTMNASILNVDLSLNISSFDKFKDVNGSTIIDKINTRQGNICVGSNLLFSQDQLTIKNHPEFSNLSIKHDLNMIATSSQINSCGKMNISNICVSNISSNFISVSNKLQAKNISSTAISVSSKITARNLSAKHISNIGVSSYLYATNISVDNLHISSPLTLTNNILSSNAIINLSSTNQLQMGGQTLTQILDNIDIDTDNLSVGVLNISEKLNLSVLNSCINMVSGTTLNLSNSSQMIINGSTLGELLNQTSGTNLLVNSISLIGTNTCINVNQNGKLNVCNFNQIVDTNLCTLTDKLDDKQNNICVKDGLTFSSNEVGVNSIAQSKITGLTNSLNLKQNNICVKDGLSFSNSEVGVNSIAQSKITGLSNSFNAKQNNICVKDGLSFSNSEIGVNSIAHTKISYANNGAISFPSAFQLNFQGVDGEVNMAGGRIGNTTSGVVKFNLANRGTNYDSHLTCLSNTCINLCNNAQLKLNDFNQIVKGSTNLQSTLNTYATTTALNNAIAPLVTTTALNSALAGYVTTATFNSDMADKQDLIVSTDNIETYQVGGLTNIRLKNEITVTKINSSDVNFSNDSITFDMVDGLVSTFQGKQNVLSLGNNLEFDSNTSLRVTDEITVTKINSSDVNFSDDSITFDMVDGLVSAFQGKQNLLAVNSGELLISNNLLSVVSIAQNKVSGLSTSLQNKQDVLTFGDYLYLDPNDELNLSSNISVNNISLNINGTVTDLGPYLSSNTQLTGFFNISVHNGSIDTKRDMNLSSLNVSTLNARDLQIIINGTFSMRNTQLPARKGELEITTSSFNISTSSDLPIGFKITNTERMKLTHNELTLDCNLSQGQNYSANISNLTSNVLMVNQIHASSIENTSSVKANVAIIQNSNNDKLYIDGLFSGTSYFDINSTGIPIYFNVKTNPFNNINNMEMTTTKTVLYKDLEMNNTVAANISNLSCSTLSVSTFNITQTSFTSLNASTANTSNINTSNVSTDLVNFQDIEFKRNNNRLMRLFQDGTMTTLELKGGTASGSAARIRTIHSNGDYWDQESPVSEMRFKFNGTEHFGFNTTSFWSSASNATKNLESDPAVLILRNPSSGFVGGHFGRFLRFTGNFYDGGSYNTYIMPRRGNNNNQNGLVMYSTVGGSFHIAFNQSALDVAYNFKVNGSAAGTSNWNNASDDRIKYNEEDIQGLNVVRQLNPKKYDKIVEFGEEFIDNSYNTWMPPSDISFNENPSKYKSIKEAGIIAQDLLNTDLSFVVTNEESQESAFSVMTVDYNSIFVYAVQAIKELDIKVNNLETKVNHLESENEILRGLIQ